MGTSALECSLPFLNVSRPIYKANSTRWSIARITRSLYTRSQSMAGPSDATPVVEAQYVQTRIRSLYIS